MGLTARFHLIGLMVVWLSELFGRTESAKLEDKFDLILI